MTAATTTDTVVDSIANASTYRLASATAIGAIDVAAGAGDLARVRVLVRAVLDWTKPEADAPSDDDLTTIYRNDTVELAYCRDSDSYHAHYPATGALPSWLVPETHMLTEVETDYDGSKFARFDRASA